MFKNPPNCSSRREEAQIQRVLPIDVSLLTSAATIFSDNYYLVLEDANAVDFDCHDILLRERKGVRGDDAGACQQYRAVGKHLTAEEKAGQFIERPFHLAHRGFAGKDAFSP